MKNAFRIGEWRIEPQADRIVSPDKTIKIEPRVMQVLVYLAEHAGEVATREQILKAVWEEAFVTDEVLSIAISKLRRLTRWRISRQIPARVSMLARPQAGMALTAAGRSLSRSDFG